MKTRAILVKERDDCYTLSGVNNVQKEAIEYNTNALIEYFDTNELWDKAATYCTTLANYCLIVCVLLSLEFPEERITTPETFVTYIYDFINNNIDRFNAIDDSDSMDDIIVNECVDTMREAFLKDNIEEEKSDE